MAENLPDTASAGLPAAPVRRVRSFGRFTTAVAVLALAIGGYALWRLDSTRDRVDELNRQVAQLARDGDVALRDKIVDLLARGRRKLVLNLAGVTYVDSAGLGQLVQVQTKAASSGALMKMVSPGTRLMTLLRIAKLLPLFDLADSDPDPFFVG